MGNLVKTGVLLAALTVLLVLIGGALGGQQGMILAFVMAMVMNFGSYWFSDRIVLAMYRAQPVDEAQAPGLYRIVRTLATRAGMPMPRVYILPDETPNAFATGRNPQHAAVAVTDGIMRIMSEEELEGVLAHELSHVRNRDTLIMAIAATLAGAITYVAHMAQWAMIFGSGRRDSDEHESGAGGALAGLLMIVVAPIAATLIQLAVSRSREFQADTSGAQMAGQPWGLAKALEKLDMASKMVPMQQATPATAHLFIVNPLTGGGWTTLFSTHPPIAERVARLRAMSRTQAR
jgi:heat shock protein HtpX